MPPNARDDRDIDLVLPWRKAFPICKPPVPGDLGDAERFIKEFERGADRYDLDTDWTLADHLRGVDDGGRNGPGVLKLPLPTIAGAALLCAAATYQASSDAPGWPHITRHPNAGCAGRQ